MMDASGDPSRWDPKGKASGRLRGVTVRGGGGGTPTATGGEVEEVRKVEDGEGSGGSIRGAVTIGGGGGVGVAVVEGEERNKDCSK